jgi:adenine C2-methylase RlmN of 23S rRNA A2503 and tRNA A37
MAWLASPPWLTSGLCSTPQVKLAVSMMTDTRYFGLSKRQVSISTVGVVPRILSLAQDLPVSAAWVHCCRVC